MKAEVAMRLNYIASLVLFAAITSYVVQATWSSLSPRYYRAELERLVRGRTPAALGKAVDFSRIDGAELVTSNEQRLLRAARLVVQDSELGIELGNFVVRDAQGNRQLACDHFNQLALRFEADGISEGGRKPQMEIDGACRTADDITRIEPIWIPVDKIVEEKPVDMDLSFDDGVRFKFRDMTSEWPSRWVLRSVRLYHEFESGRDLTLDGPLVRAIRPSSLMLNW